MKVESNLVQISLNELQDLLNTLDPKTTTNFALIGPRVTRLSASPANWPKSLHGRVVYQLTDVPPYLPRQLFRLVRLHDLVLWALHLKGSDAASIAQGFSQLTSLDLNTNHVGDAGARAIAEGLDQLTSLNLWGNSH